MSHFTVFPILLPVSWIHILSTPTYNYISVVCHTCQNSLTLVIIIMLSLSLSPLNTMFSTGHCMSAHRFVLRWPWPLIAPLQPVNSTGGVLWLKELEMAKQVWAGQGYIHEWGWDKGGYTFIHNSWVYISYSTRLMCVWYEWIMYVSCMQGHVHWTCLVCSLEKAFHTFCLLWAFSRAYIWSAVTLLCEIPSPHDQC